MYYLWVISLVFMLLSAIVQAHEGDHHAMPKPDKQVIPVATLTAPLELDGSDADWGEVASVLVPLHKSIPTAKTTVQEVQIKAGVWEDTFYLYASWTDPDKNVLHKPYVWSEEKQRYVKGAAREDRFSIQFEISGDYTTNWLSGHEFIADMWHWKAGRTNPMGVANDKYTRISHEKLLRASLLTSEEGETLYLLRAWDAGDRNYITKRYGKKIEDVMPKYVMNHSAAGSTMDVKARGVWKAGRWSLELSRKLETGHDDDVVFVKGQAIDAGIGIFESSENNDHAISNTIVFQF